MAETFREYTHNWEIIMDRSRLLGEEKIGKLLLNFSIPAIVGMVVNALYNVVDRIFVGKGVGPLAISATSVAFPIPIIIMAFGMLVGIGAAATVSIKLGQNKRDEAEHILGNAFTLVVAASIFVTVLGLVFINPLLKLFGASPEVFPLAKQFVTIILIGAVLQNIGFGLNNLIRASGDPRTSMFTMLIGAFLNFIFNPLFIFVFGLGIRGSALATIVSQSVCSVWVLRYFTSHRSLLRLKIHYLAPVWSNIRQIFAIGMSPFLMQLAACVITIIFNNSLAVYGGDTALAAMGIINSVANLILMPIFGINQGSQPIIGYNYGAKNYARAIKALKLAALAATAISTAGFILTELFPEAIINAFSSSNADLLQKGTYGIRIFLLMLPIIGFQIVSSNFFQAIGKAQISIFLSLSRQVIILLPLLLILPGLFHLTGIWAAGPVSDFLSSVLTALLLLRELRRLANTDPGTGLVNT